MLFMGEEFGAKTPFMYFISHSDPDLVNAVREGRAREFREIYTGKDMPDPQNPETFYACKLCWECLDKPDHAQLLSFYKELISLRKSNSVLSKMDKKNCSFETLSEDRVLIINRWDEEQTLILIMNFSGDSVPFFSLKDTFRGRKILDSSDSVWGGTGSEMPNGIIPDVEYVMQPYQFIIYTMH